MRIAASSCSWICPRWLRSQSDAKNWLALVGRLSSIRARLSWRECKDPWACGSFQRFKLPPLPSPSSILSRMVGTLDASAASMQLADEGALKQLQQRLQRLERLELEFHRFEAAEFEIQTRFDGAPAGAGGFMPSLRSLRLGWSYVGGGPSCMLAVHISH